MMARSSFMFMSIFVISASHAFIFNDFAPFPLLNDLAKAQTTDRSFKIHMDIFNRQNKEMPHLILNGLELTLSSTTPVKGSIVELPGVEGPHPQTSSGAKSLVVTKLPSFIAMNGLQRVQFNRGGWEMVWKKSSPAGALICGFDIPQEVIRNAASVKLPKGSLYVTFPLYTPERLATLQVQKAEAEKRAQKHDNVKNEKLAELNQESNFLRKMILYREAIEADERKDLSGVKFYSWIPSNDGVLELNPGVLLGTTGSVFSVAKTDVFKTKTVIGSATLRPGDPMHDESVLRP